MVHYVDGAGARKYQKEQQTRRSKDLSRSRKERGQRADVFRDRTHKAEGLHSRGSGDLANGTAAVIGVSAALTRDIIGFDVVRSWI